MTATSIRFNSEHERKSYERGLAIVAKKLDGNRRMTPEGRHQYSMAVGLATVAVVKKMSALLKDGVPATQTTARAASTITAKAPTRPTDPVAPTRKNYTLHRYACKNWLPTLA